jgi:hypothetical protein
MTTESLSDSARTLLLARLASTITICARDTYEAGTENVLDPRLLRAYNELLHRITGSVVSHLLGEKGYPLETIVEMVDLFGVHHNRAAEMNWAMQQALQRSKNDAMP